MNTPSAALNPANGSTPVTPGQEGGTKIPPGTYQMRATDADLGYTAGSENEPAKPQVAVLLEFVDGPFAGQSLTWYGFFTEKTKAGTIRALRTIGWTGNDLSDLSTARGEAPCVVQNETDLQGVARAKVRFIGGGALALKNVMSDEQKKAFAVSMQAFAAGIVSEAKKPAEAGAGPAATGPNGLPVGPDGKPFF